MQTEGDVLGRGELSGGMSDFVLVALVLEDEFAAVIPKLVKHVGRRRRAA